MKLNITRFAGSASITLSLQDNEYNPARYVYFSVTQTGPTTFNWKVWNAKAKSNDAYMTAHQFHFWINGDQVWDMSGISGYNTQYDRLGTAYHVFPVTISSDGVSGTYTSNSVLSSFTIEAKAGYYSSSYVKTASANFECLTYNFSRQPSISLNTKDETSIKVNWSTSETCSQIKWYRGSTLVATTTPNATSGNYTFTGLTAGQSYNLKGTFTRSDSGYTWDSNVLTQSTNNYPTVTGTIPTITLGSGNVTNIINITNPHNRSTTVYAKLNNSSGETLASTTTTGTTATLTFNSSTLYSKIPSSPSGTIYYYCVYSGHTTTGKTGTFQINGNERPTFPTSSWHYSTNLGSLTGNNNQTIINGYSTVTVSIDTAASSAYSANITSYYATWGGANGTTSSISTPITLSGGSGASLVVLANDSRNLQSSQSLSTLNITNNLVLYTKPVINNDMTTHRTNGIDTTVILNATGTMFAGTFGTNGVQNAIHSLKYRVKPSGGSWSNYFDVPSGTYSFDNTTGQFTITNASIHANGSSGGFTSGTAYTVELQIYDAQGLLGYGTKESSITDGKLARDVYKDSNGNYHEGINGLADSNYTQTIHGKINVTDGYYLNGELFGFNPLDCMPVGYVYISASSTSPANLFGGTWERLNGYYPYFGNGYNKTTYTGKNTQSHTLTVEQIPSHGHSGYISVSGTLGGSDYYNFSPNGVTNNQPNNGSLRIGNTGGGQGHSHNIATVELYAWRRTA